MVWPFNRRSDRDALASHRRGVELLRRNQPALALEELKRAVQLGPDNAEFLKSYGNAARALGDLEGAIESYRRSLQVAPDYMLSLYNLGLVLHEINRPDEAERCFRRVLEIDPRDADALFYLGALLHAQSRFADAAQMYRRALELTPDNPYLRLYLGKAWGEMPGQIEESIRCLRGCIELKQDLAEAHYQLGLAYKKLGRTDDAVRACRKVLELEPQNAGALDVLGNVLQDEGRLDEAMEHYREAIRSSPDYAAAHNNLGCTLIRRNRLDEAADCFRKAIDLQPDFAGAYLNLGNVHGLRGARDQALRCYDVAQRIRPDDAAVRECLLFEMQHVCDWSRFDELCALQRRSIFNHSQHPISPFSLLSIPSTPEEQLQCAKNFAERQWRAVARDRERLGFRFDRSPKGRLKIGYLSADFHEHATAYLMAELFELHDRRDFEVIGYSYGPDDGSPMRGRLTRAFNRFVDISALSHAEAAAAIHADRVDILVDLKGYTQHARTEIMALRPAPVQASYLGYPGTMGADFIDYLIADRIVIPLGQQDHYSEKLVFLPGCYQVNDRKRSLADTPSRVECGLPEKSLVFCCFNQAYKILPDVYAIWMRLLGAVPGSVLWLLESNPWATRNLRREAANHGVEPDRLIFSPRVSLDQHLRRLRAADLFLDTLPYNAHTTASDALWVGLPVLTCAGNTFASRVAASLLTSVGMPELITRSMAEYEALALRLAHAPAERAALRDKLVRDRFTTPLFDTPKFARNLEAAYEQMWQNYLAGDAARALDPRALQAPC